MSHHRLAYSPKEAAEMIGLGRSTLYNAIRSGHLRTVKVGRRVLVRHEALLEFLDQREAINDERSVSR